MDIEVLTLRKWLIIGFLLTIAAMAAMASIGAKGVMADTTIKEFLLPENLSSPGALTIDPSGKIWFSEKIGRNIVEFDSGKEKFKAYPLPESWGNVGPAGITIGPEGNLWFTVHRWAESEDSTDIIGKFNPAEGKYTIYKELGKTPEELLIEPSGIIWFLDENSLNRFDPNTSEIKGYEIPTPNSHPRGLTSDGAGNLWFVEANANKIVGFSIEKGLFGEAQIPTQFSNPSGVAVDGEGNIWFTGFNSNRLAVFYPKTGKFNEIDIPTPQGLPNRLALDGEGGLWFLEYRGNKVGHFNPLEATFIEIEIPTFNSLPDGLVIDKERGYLWFAETATEARRLGRLSIKEAMARGSSRAEIEKTGTGQESADRNITFIVAIVVALGGLGAFMLYRKRHRAKGMKRRQ